MGEAHCPVDFGISMGFVCWQFDQVIKCTHAYRADGERKPYATQARPSVHSIALSCRSMRCETNLCRN